MDITDYAKRLIKLKWNYQSLPLNLWNAAHKDYEYLLRLSWTSPEWRKCWVDAKQRAKNKGELK